ncbi:hypothetical protein C0Q70_15713 [Pomacea canaliculata]|uniref:Tc1-like transposase DDE domain-containing protein n=1 Tax=Pomacea canaliculata TaxID=400727 RepID=A0A2T7NVM5_POMCA|nr:hypothetical protein C0Q70_15713 [Pomacea canaliculata]
MGKGILAARASRTADVINHVGRARALLHGNVNNTEAGTFLAPLAVSRVCDVGVNPVSAPPPPSARGTVLLLDNAHPQTAAHTVEAFQKLKIKVLAQPLYTPDLGPSDYHLLEPLMEAVNDRQLTWNGELKEEVHMWVTEKNKRLMGRLDHNEPPSSSPDPVLQRPK